MILSTFGWKYVLVLCPVYSIYVIQLDVHRRSQDSALLAVKERNRPVGELLKF